MNNDDDHEPAKGLALPGLNLILGEERVVEQVDNIDKIDFLNNRKPIQTKRKHWDLSVFVRTPGVEEPIKIDNISSSIRVRNLKVMILKLVEKKPEQ